MNYLITFSASEAARIWNKPKKEVRTMKEATSKSLIKGNKKEGFILVIGIFTITFLLLFAFPFLSQLSTDFRLNEKSYKSSAAFSLAEAGVERAIWELNYGDISSWSGDGSLRTMTISSFQTPDGHVKGKVEISVENPGADNPVVEVTGMVVYIGSHNAIRTARVALENLSGIYRQSDLPHSR